ncbi:MAG: DUF2911 domain-containing protein [Planctomycetes bacterium]|nr:DUF2911 domain-containing protein [Planctomycetota bacterium]
MIRLASLSALAAALALATPSSAQVQVFGGDGPRMASTRIFWNNGPVGMMCIQYGQPEWKAEYDAMRPKLTGKQLRLGKDFWTTFNTTCLVTIGGTEIPAGSYYLGLKCDDDGNFHLLVMSAEDADAEGWAPFVPDAWEADYVCPLKMTAAEDSAAKMQISLASVGDDPTKMTFSVRWGTHVLAAATEAHLGKTGHEVEHRRGHDDDDDEGEEEEPEEEKPAPRGGEIRRREPANPVRR